MNEFEPGRCPEREVTNVATDCQVIAGGGSSQRIMGPISGIATISISLVEPAFVSVDPEGYGKLSLRAVNAAVDAKYPHSLVVFSLPASTIMVN
jgi:hypothetical protein